MIKQFNFYDIYGYLLPGGLLLGLLWLPLGLLTQSLPGESISKAVFLTGLAYIVGLLVQSVGADVVPSKVNGRAPSESVLDSGQDKDLSKDVKEQLSAQVFKIFGIDLKVGESGDGKNAASGNRKTAFFEARAYLIQKKAAAYAEQFEGMYVMMRGLACALGAGAAYLAGWALSIAALTVELMPRLSHVAHSNLSAEGLCVGRIVMVVCTVAAPLGTLVTRLRAKTFWNDKRWPKGVITACWLGDCLAGGYWLGSAMPLTQFKSAPTHPQWILWAAVLLSVFVMLQCYAGYRSFAKTFALTVWRDFSACYALNAPGKPGTSGADDATQSGDD